MDGGVKMGKESGVEILLVEGAKIPSWLTMSRWIQAGYQMINGRKIPFVRIRKGEASFADATSFIAQFPGSKGFIKVFDTSQVLAIRDLEGKIIRENYHFCQKCFANTGVVVGYEPSVFPFGRTDYKFRCDNCQSNWKVKGG